MHNVTATQESSTGGMRGTPDAQPQPATDARNDRAGETPIEHARPGRHVSARDLHPGDVIVQFDWSLHIREVEVDNVAVAIEVTEFGFPLHYSADEQITLAA